MTDDMTRLGGGIRASNDGLGRAVRDLERTAGEMKRAVAYLRNAFVADTARSRAGLFGATAPASHRAGVLGAAPPKAREAQAEREDVLQEA